MSRDVVPMLLGDLAMLVGWKGLVWDAGGMQTTGCFKGFREG